MWNKLCVLAQSACIDGNTDKSELPCAQWHPVTQECLIITRAEYSVVYYRVVLSHLDEAENPLGGGGVEKGTKVSTSVREKQQEETS